MHRHSLLWRATGVLITLVLLSLPAAAARHRSSTRSHKSSRHRTHQVRSTTRTRVAVHRSHRHTARAKRHTRVAARVTSAKAPRVYTVRRGDTLERIGKRLGVSAIMLARVNHLPDADRLAEGQTLRLPGPVQIAAAPGAVSDSRSMVSEALSYRGVPYRYAGTTSRGMDCSGLVSRVLMSHGIRAPHNAASLYQLGKAVSYGQLQPGDLVFFNTRGRRISHVGIYTGNGKFVHASSGTGCVTVSSLSEKYYQRRLVGARRLTKD